MMLVEGGKMKRKLTMTRTTFSSAGSRAASTPALDNPFRPCETLNSQNGNHTFWDT